MVVSNEVSDLRTSNEVSDLRTIITSQK